MNIKQKIYLISGLCLIIAILLIGETVKPLLLEIKTTSVLVKGRNEQLSMLQKTDQEYLKQLETDYTDIEQSISLIKAGFINKDEIIDFFIELENIALQTSNDLEIDIEEFPVFSLYLLGDFPNLMKFLGWLENGKYFLNVDLLEIKQFKEKGTSLGQEASSTGQVKTMLKIRSHTKDSKVYEKQKNLKSS